MAEDNLLVYPVFTYDTMHNHILPVLESDNVTDPEAGGSGSAHGYHITHPDCRTHTGRNQLKTQGASPLTGFTVQFTQDVLNFSV
jgi:hypothetical protein